jgi:pimeloyl-ACP methyl ester carboxylesterase
VVNVRRWGDALFAELTPLGAFRSLDVPVLLMVGQRTTGSALAVTKLLMTALPCVELVELDELGHMGPVTHPEQVNAVIKTFLERVSR